MYLDVGGEFTKVRELHCSDAVESNQLLLLSHSETVDLPLRLLLLCLTSVFASRFGRVQFLNSRSYAVSGG